MRDVSVNLIRDKVAKLCISANKTLPCDLVSKISECAVCERNSTAASILKDLQDNIVAAKEMDIPVCQDTGMAVVFLSIGQEVHLTDGNLRDAVNEGVRLGYNQGLLRKSVVSDPLCRVNTNDNTPAVIHIDIVEGSNVEITVAPKGFGSENMSKIYMLNPSDSRQGVINAVLSAVKSAASNPCPPMVVGVGIGGDFEQCAFLSKKALCRSSEIRNANEYYRELEDELLKEINKLDIGPQGFGGDTTALYVNIETASTHIAGLPVAVNIGCHVTRHESCVI
ncbi:MAG: fumarate hydratase [Acutalibacteraceae bacterium]|nr:fumarate hydratase [Acutalibacteraceae bacterium]